MEVQMNGEWTRSFWRIYPDHDLSSWLRDWDLYVLNTENGRTLIIVSACLDDLIKTLSYQGMLGR